METVLESQHRAVETAARIANEARSEARSQQSNNMQELQLSLVKCETYPISQSWEARLAPGLLLTLLQERGFDMA